MFNDNNLDKQISALKALAETANPESTEEQQQQQQQQEPAEQQQQEEEQQQQQQEPAPANEGGEEVDEATLLINSIKAGLGLDDLDIDLSSHDALTEAIKGGVEKIRGADPFAEIPELKPLYDWVKAGGTIEQFQQRPVAQDFKSVEITEDNVELQTNYAIEYLMFFKGMEQEDAQALANTWKDTGKLYSTALTAQNEFQAWSDKQVADYDAKIKQENEAERIKREDSWKEADKVLNEGFKVFHIPQKDLAGFKEFVKPNAQGISKAAEAHKALTVEERLALDYLIYTKFNGVYNRPSPEQVKKTINVKPIIGGKTTGTAATASQEETLSALSALEQRFRGQ